METRSIMIVGVGGQGSLLASRLLGNVLLAQGYDVKVSEVHGMSQRGGSVVTYVKYGDKVYSPVVEKGEADVVISFELLEAARCLPYLKKGGKLITSTQQIDPMPVITGAAEYPEDLADKLSAAGVELVAVDALALAERLTDHAQPPMYNKNPSAPEICTHIIRTGSDIVNFIIKRSLKPNGKILEPRN